MNSKESPLYLNYSENERDSEIERLQKIEWDLLVIGGGITGAGIAREAAFRGLTVALLEMNDFAYGTSSGSSKLAHGGIRYLAQREFGLVREATTERNWLRDKAIPHLVRPLQFIYPIFSERNVGGRQLPRSKDSVRKIRFAAFLYDLLCGFHNYGSREVVKEKSLRELEPAFDSTGLVGAVLYYDTNLGDERLTIETIWDGLRTGLVCVVNYMAVTDLMLDSAVKICGVVAKNRIGPSDEAESIQVRAKAVVNATGVWADRILEMGQKPEVKIIRPTKGVHIAVPRSKLPVNRAFGLRSLDDDRFFFVLPRNDWVLIGTTDTDFSGDPSECYCNSEDADYLRRTVNVLFPDAKIENDDLLGSYAALRPLVYEPGKSESEVSRKHLILERSDGLLTIVGGKLTTYRKMAEDLLLDHLKKWIKKGYPKFSTRKGLAKVPYTVALSLEDWKNSKVVRNSTLDSNILRHLYQQYGKGGLLILRNLEGKTQLIERLLTEYPTNVCPWILGEIDYIIRRECPVHLVDVLARRMEVAWLVHPKYQGKIAGRVAQLMANILGWSEERKDAEIQQYINHVKRNSFFYEGEIATS